VKRLLRVLNIAMLWPAAATWAQLLPPNEAGVTLGQFHTIVRDVAETKKFWTLLGGKSLTIDGTDVVKFPGVFIFLTKGMPSGGSYGSVVNHVGFMVPNDEEAIAKWKAGGLTAEYLPSAYVPTVKLGYAYTPDDLKVRINRDKSMTAPIGSPLIMMWVSKAAVPDVQAWYIKMFGAKQGQPINNGVSVVGIPGLRLSVVSSIEDPISRTPPAVGLLHGAPPDSAFMEKLLQTNLDQPIKGRTLDHVGFEVENLEAFCKKLEASGVKFDEPYSKTRHKDFASAKFTDPWGLSVELTEGLKQF
jgi:catechol 2,3-dioxygenase-like lactoylglutathione lyase family enzyme